MKESNNVEQERESNSYGNTCKKRDSFFAVLGIALLIFILGLILGEGITKGINAMVPRMESGIRFAIENYFGFIATLALVIIYCSIAEKDIFHNMLWPCRGGLPGNTGKCFFFGLIIGFATNTVCVFFAWLKGDIALSYDGINPMYYFVAFFMVLIQSAAEELLMRGYLLQTLCKRYNQWLAIIINSSLFSVFHIFIEGSSAVSTINILLFGVSMSLIVCRFKSLWACIGIHTAWNYTQNFLFGLPNSGIVAEKSIFHLDNARSSPLYDNGFGVEGGIVMMIELLITIIIIVVLKKKSGGIPESQC